MKNNEPAKDVPKAAPLKTNVCGSDIAATGKAAMNANNTCEQKINSAVEELKTPGAESA